MTRMLREAWRKSATHWGKVRFANVPTKKKAALIARGISAVRTFCGKQKKKKKKEVPEIENKNKKQEKTPTQVVNRFKQSHDVRENRKKRRFIRGRQCNGTKRKRGNRS